MLITRFYQFRSLWSLHVSKSTPIWVSNDVFVRHVRLIKLYIKFGPNSIKIWHSMTKSVRTNNNLAKFDLLIWWPLSLITVKVSNCVWTRHSVSASFTSVPTNIKICKPTGSYGTNMSNPDARTDARTHARTSIEQTSDGHIKVPPWELENKITYW